MVQPRSNPCAAKKPCAGANPCASKNPCSASNQKNPCAVKRPANYSPNYDEHWRDAEATLALVRDFKLDHAWPSWPVNRWLSAMAVAFYPYLEAFMRHRDHEMCYLMASGLEAIHENRDIEVIGQLPTSLPHWEERLAARLGVASLDVRE